MPEQKYKSRSIPVNTIDEMDAYARDQAEKNGHSQPLSTPQVIEMAWKHFKECQYTS